MLLICSPGVVLEGLLNYQWQKSILFRQNAQRQSPDECFSTTGGAVEPRQCVRGKNQGHHKIIWICFDSQRFSGWRSKTNYLCNKLPVNVIYIMMIMMMIVLRSPTTMIIIHDDRQETALDGATSRRSSCFTPRAKVLAIFFIFIMDDGMMII